ncbi:hypothetical protein BUQ74_18185 [Leptospira weilii serovar Heyan]|nr:hypothetical protein BUQ74_18185 [Leptospira weilii serovar Heyan]
MKFYAGLDQAIFTMPNRIKNIIYTFYYFKNNSVKAEIRLQIYLMYRKTAPKVLEQILNN